MIAEYICPMCHRELDLHEEGGHPRHAEPCPVCDGERCYLCRRINVSFVSVDMDGAIRSVCDTCWERGEEGIDIPLDMTEDRWDA